MAGDQFHRIAMAWLVLKLTGDPWSLGLIMALGGVPFAVFTLLGGALTDRMPARRVMLVADIFRLCISAMIAAQLFTNTLEIWMIYAYTVRGRFKGGDLSSSGWDKW